ncbi:MAG TPA: YceI family protein [Chloroflexi bacterium]|nr:YceI family protein [Chloroflexota bacterium]
MFRTITQITLLLFLLTFVAACSGQPAAPTATPAPPTEAPAVDNAPTADNAPAAEAPIAGQRTFVIVPAESKASYLVDEEFFAGALAKLGIAAGLADVVGSTQEIEGRLTLNLDDLSAPLGENTFTVKMNTFTTDQKDRDKWIRENGPRFNDFPLATFTATAIEGAPAAYNAGEEVSFKLSGDLTIREITRPVTFDVTASLSGDTLTGVATTRLKMSDFGIEPPNFANTLTVADEFGIEVQITAKAE